MKITNTVSYNLIFTVECYWSEEGGMGFDDFGPECKTIQEALHYFELAKAKEPNEDWMICCRVTKEIK